jgi:hypothetical protein
MILAFFNWIYLYGYLGLIAGISQGEIELGFDLAHERVEFTPQNWKAWEELS